MDIEKLKKYTQDKIEAGNSIKQARQIIKNEQYEKQDLYEGISEKYKPLLDKQESIKEAIDEKQDKLIKQLQNNQRGLEDMILYAGAPERLPSTTTKLPIDYQPSMTTSKKGVISNLDNGFDTNEILMLKDYGLPPPPLVDCYGCLRMMIMYLVNIQEKQESY